MSEADQQTTPPTAVSRQAWTLFVLAAVLGVLLRPLVPEPLHTAAITAGLLAAGWFAVVAPLWRWNLAQRDALGRAVAHLERFRFAFTCVDESIVISDRDGRIQHVNPSFTRLFGYAESEVRGHKTSILSSGVHERHFYEELWQRLQHGQTWQGRVTDKAKSGELIDVLMSVSPLRDGADQLIGYVAVHRDLRPADAQERRLRELLEVERRGAEQMEALKLDAEAASAAKSRFLATMSHEIRTPLAGVLGTLELLSKEPLGPTQRYYADLALRSSRALNGVLNDVLDFSRIEAGHLVLEKTSFELSALVDGVRELFLARTRQKGLAFEVRCPVAGAGLWLKGDPVQLRQVLSNLVGNAVKFTQEGRVELTVEPRHVEAGAQLVFRVADTGVGISPEHRPALFNPFTQADASFRRRFGGSGLGLAISRRIAEAMGGTLECDSEAGVGSTFTFTVTLPLAEAVLAPTAQSTAPDERALVRGLRVLVVEDNVVNQVVVSRLLQRLGCAVTLADDGAAALALLPKLEFDVVLMDCQMPVLDGLEATRQLRAADAPWASLPVLALTANAFVEDREACLAAGMNGFLTKPVNEAVLVQSLARLGRREAPEAAHGRKAG